MIKLIDGSNMLHRKMYDANNSVGIHPLRDLYVRFIAPDKNTIIVWDGMHSNKRRRDLYPGYKQRPEKGEDMKAAFDLIKEVLCHTNVTQVEIPYWEADDVLYTLACDYRDGDEEVSIETTDQDFWQLAGSPLVKLPLVKPLPCEPEDTTVYKALMGDKSDTIGGWRGFGPAKWEALTSCHLDYIRSALEDKDYDLWLDIDWPKGLTVTEESFFQCCIFYEIVTMQRVPEEEFTDNYICGKSNPALVEEIFTRWRI